MKKSLKIALQREINIYVHNSLPLCIILADRKKYEWFMENFVNITQYEMNPEMLDFAEESDFWSDVLDVEAKRVSETEDENIIDLIVEAVNRDSYLGIYVDEYFLRNKNSYNILHYVRMLIAYGYDLEKNQILCVGYASASNIPGQNHEFDRVSFENYDFASFREACRMARAHYRETAPWAENGYRFTFSEKPGFKHEFDIVRFLENLEDYLFSRAPSSKDPEKTNYGINVYDGLLEYIDSKWTKDVPKLDFRCFYFLLEHKKNLHKRLCFVADKYQIGGVIRDYIKQYENDVLKKCNSIHLNFIKSLIRNEAMQFLDRLKKNLDKVEKAEVYILVKIYSLLKRRFRDGVLLHPPALE
ncbi:MAG: hypothetical protein HQK54_06135 [Oligoflexales bacterium]|nr:hypothetical protein [Oligoflexales bacterium]